MKHIIKYLCIVALITSCMTNRKGELTTKGINFIATHCHGKDSIVHTDNTTILFDTIKIPQYIQGATQYLENPCKNLCDSLGRLKPVSMTKTFNGITGTIKSVGNSLVVDCHTDSLMVIIETQKRVINTFETQKIVIQEPCKKEHLTGWDYFWIRTGWILFGFIILQIILKVIISVYPITKPFLGWAYLFKF